MTQALSTRVRGVYRHASHLGGDVPDGALDRADNIVIDRPHIAAPRRGLPLYGSTLAGAAPAVTRRIIAYKAALFGHQGDQLYRDTGAGTWVHERAITPPSSKVRIRSAEADRNLFVTSSEGVLKLDGIGRPWRPAGTPRPLDPAGATTGSSGFLIAQRSTAYRVFLHYTDANRKEIVSAPSQRLIVFNAEATDSRNVSLTVYLPTGLTTEYSYRAYRSATSASATAAPSDELQLVKEGRLTSADLTAGFVTFTDATIDTLRGAAAYTNPLREGIANANERPPLAVDLCRFRGHMIYVNVKGRHRYLSQLVGVGAGALTQVTQNGDIANTSAVVQNLASTASLHVGMKAKHADIPVGARILSIDSATQVTLTLPASATAAATSIEFQDLVTIAGRTYFAASATSEANQEFKASTAGSPAANIEDTARALVLVVNRDPSQALVYGYYTSGFEDIPGGLLFEERGIGGAAFGVSSTAPSAFHAPLPASQGMDLSMAVEEPGGVYISKFGQQEAVPLGTLLRGDDDEILRCFALKESVILLGKQAQRLGGRSLSDFALSTIEPTLELIGPETAVVLNDRVYAHTSQGIVAITDAGAAVVSRDIERDLQIASSDETFPDFRDVAHAASYESDRAYTIWMQGDPDEVEPRVSWRYNAFTGAWTGPLATLPATCALVNPENRRLYLGDYTSGGLRRERKSFTREDFADDQFALSIISSAGAEVTVSSTASLAAGYLLKQGAAESRIEEVIDATTLRVADVVFWSAAAAIAYMPIECVMEWVPITGGNPGIAKLWPEFAVLFRSADFATFSAEFATDFLSVFEAVTLRSMDKGGGWGDFPWGDVPWGDAVRDEQIILTQLPESMRQAHWIRVALRFREVFSSFGVCGFSTEHHPASSKFHAGRAA